MQKPGSGAKIQTPSTPEEHHHLLVCLLLRLLLSPHCEAALRAERREAVVGDVVVESFVKEGSSPHGVKEQWELATLA